MPYNPFPLPPSPFAQFQTPYKRPQPSIGPDPNPYGSLEDDTNIDRASLAALQGLKIPSGWGGGQGGSASGSPYDRAEASRAAGAYGQVGGDINLPSERSQPMSFNSPADEDMNRRADALTNRPSYNDFTTHPASAVQGLQAASPAAAPQSSRNAITSNFKPSSPQVAAGILKNSPMSANNPLELSSLLQGRKREAEDRAINNPDARNVAYLKQAEGDIAENPSFGDEAQARTAGINKAVLGANLGGYGSPQEAAEGAREAEAYKQNAPVRAQEMAGKYDLQKQQEASKGALDVAKENQSGLAARYGAMQDLLQGGGAGQLSSVNPTSGAMGFRAPQQIATPILRDVTTAKQFYDRAVAAGGDHWYSVGSPTAAAKQQLQSAIDTALSQYQFDPGDKTALRDAILDPSTKGKRLEEVFDTSQMSPQEMQQITNFITLIGGF